MSTETIMPSGTAQATQKLRIDFLFLDLTTCTRCLGADANLHAALSVVRDVLAATGVDVEVTKVHVTSEQQARTLRFVTSPTIRVNGADVALELKESSCGSEACTDGCGDHIDCRVWVHHGREYTEPPVAMIVDAVLRQVYGAVVTPEESQRYELPENLQRFFAAKAETGCCPAAEQQTCCDASAKEDCCGTSTEQGCGCR